jgi:hypothetical protein
VNVDDARDRAVRIRIGEGQAFRRERRRDDSDGGGHEDRRHEQKPPQRV